MSEQRSRQARRSAAVQAPRVDSWLLASAVALAALGLVMVASASMSVAQGQGAGPFHYIARQSLFLVVGVGAGLAAYHLRLDVLAWLSRPALGVSLLLLALVLVPGLGTEINGARRWIDLGPVNLQVAEPAKLAFIVYVAGYLERRGKALRERFFDSLKPLLLAMLAGGLLLLQPDYGAAVLLLAIVAGMIWLAGARWWHVGGLGLLAVPAIGSAAFLESYRINRLTAFLDPWARPYSDGFQLTQALIAVGRGEWVGVGLGASVQKLFYLPEAHTDFLFAVLAEELGLLGVAAVIALFAVLVGRGLRAGARAAEAGRPFGAYLAVGIALWLALQAAVSIGVNLGVLPTKGLTLPLMSHGGSSLVVTCIAVGLLLRVGAESVAAPARSRRRS